MADDPKVIAWRKAEADDATAEKKERGDIDSVIGRLSSGQSITRAELQQLLGPIIRKHYGIAARNSVSILP